VSALGLIYPALLVLTGLALLLDPRRFRKAKERDYQERLAERMERGTDAYFEELRELKAYPPPRINGWWQMLGIVMILGGGFMLADAVRRL
jgi:hypothetical protein